LAGCNKLSVTFFSTDNKAAIIPIGSNMDKTDHAKKCFLRSDLVMTGVFEVWLHVPISSVTGATAE
jgi:hypothetical protein